jgi:flagellar biosynthesis component FlhA
MKYQKSLALIVATVMLFSFVAVPPANAFVGLAALSAILAISFASAVAVNETVIKQNNEKPNNEAMPEHAILKKNTQDNLKTASSKP